MSWYATGTVAVTNNNTAVVGTGTQWVANVQAGDIFWGPEGRGYEIVSVNSNTSLTIGPAYAGATAGGQAYRIAPTQGRVVNLTAGVNQLLTDFGGIRDGIGSGNFPDGTAAAPALRFGADTDTGLYRAAGNVFGFAAGGVARMAVTSGGVRIGDAAMATATLDVSGGILAGTGNATTGAAVLGTRYNDGQVATFGNLRGSGSLALGFCVAPSAAASDAWVSSVSNAWGRAGIKVNASQMSIGFAASQTTTIGDTVALTNALIVNAGGAITPGGDNSQALGSGALRFTTAYLGSNPIVSCDLRFKRYRSAAEVAAAEHAALLEIFDAFGFFQFEDAIALKGEDDARWHFGPKAQGVWAIWASHGLTDALDEDGKPVAGCVPPAFLCFDEWDDGAEERPVYSATLVDAGGNPIQIGTEAVATRDPGYLFGLRMDELHSLLLAALNKERKDQASAIAAMEARLASLEAA